ncbi:hypothetical protein [Spirilliplanes yamanashiensis]|uniref:hypothetical protein n=1 Tax=Spirilliplanes yamanashiensis TaxID=42233 RepID=UPI0019523643|nr:hypothetical protein [Spirilliplanes yamanashiensis]MDP9818514.1 hypothetical protein [Spirilliplanes yamanashiensis]
MTAPDPTTSIPLALFDDVVKWSQRRTDLGAWAVEPGSALHGDDRWADPYRVSHAAQHRLHSAIDNLHAVKLLLVDAATLPTFATFTLIRAGMENAAVVSWLLQPADQPERVRRRLQLEAGNAKNRDTALTLMLRNAGPDEQAAAAPLAEVLERLRGIGEAHGIPGREIDKRLPGWADIVKAATKHPRLSDIQLFQWRMCSALSHAEEWPSHILLSTPVGDDVDGVVTLHVETPAGLAQVSFGLASGMLRDAINLYDTRRMASRTA